MPPKGGKLAKARAAAKAAKDAEKAMATAKDLPLFTQQREHFIHVFNEGLVETQAEIDGHIGFLRDYWEDILSGASQMNPPQMLKTPGKLRARKRVSAEPVRTITAASQRSSVERNSSTQKATSGVKRKLGFPVVEIISNPRARASMEQFFQDDRLSGGSIDSAKRTKKGENKSDAVRKNEVARVDATSSISSAEVSPVPVSKALQKSVRIQPVNEQSAAPPGPPVRASKRVQDKLADKPPPSPRGAQTAESPTIQQPHTSQKTSDTDSDMEVDELEEQADQEPEQMVHDVMEEMQTTVEADVGSLTERDNVEPEPAQSAEQSTETGGRDTRPVSGIRNSAVPLSARQVRVPSLMNKLVAASRYVDDEEEEEEEISFAASVDSLFDPDLRAAAMLDDMVTTISDEYLKAIATPMPKASQVAAELFPESEETPIARKREDDDADDFEEATPQPHRRWQQDEFEEERSLEHPAVDLSAEFSDFAETPRPAPKFNSLPVEQHNSLASTPRPSSMSGMGTTTSMYTSLASQVELDARSREQLWDKTVSNSEGLKKLKQGLEAKRLKQSLQRAAAQASSPRPSAHSLLDAEPLSNVADQSARSSGANLLDYVAPPKMDRTVFGSLKLPFETPDEPATPLGSRSQTADHHPYHTPLGKDFTPRSILRVRSQHETPTRPADGQVNDISVTTESDWFDAQEPRPSQDVPASNLSSQALDDHPSRPNAQSTSSVVERTETETSIYTDARSYVSEAGLRHGDKSVTFDLSTPEPESGNESETIQRLDSPPTVKQAVFEPYGLESSKSASSQPSSVSFLPQAVSKISMMNQQIPQSKVLRGLGLPVKKPQPEVAQRPMTATERRCEQAKEKAQQLLEKKKHDLQMKDGERSRKAEEKRLEKLKEQEAAKRKAAERHQAAAEKRALEEANRKLNDKSTAILHTTTVKMHASKTLNPALPSESISVPHIESIAAGAKHTRQAHNPRPPRIGSNTIVDENGDLPEPPSDYSDEEDDEEDEEVSDEESEEPQTSAGHYSNNIIDATPKRKNNKKKNEPTWVQTPELMKLIMAHERTNPDDVFGDARPPLEDVFREGMKRKPTRARADSAFTGNDCLSEAEILAYNKNMGYK